MIRIAHDFLPVVTPAQSVLVGEVVVEAEDRLPLALIARALPDVVHQVRIRLLVQHAGAGRCRVDVAQHPLRQRIERRRLSVSCRQIEQVDLARRRAGGVAEEADPRSGVEDISGAREVVRQPQLFVVSEEDALLRPSYKPGITIGPPWRMPYWFSRTSFRGSPLRVLNQ